MLRYIKKLNKTLSDPMGARRLMFTLIKVCLLCTLAVFAYLLILAQDYAAYGYFSIREMMSSISEYGAAALMLTLGGAFTFDVALKKRE